MKKYARIKEIGKVITGKTPSTENEDNFGGDFPFITPSDISTFDEKYIAETERTISSKGYKKLKNNLLPMNSVCFVCIGSTIGKMCLTNKPSFTNQQINALLVNKNYDSQYVFYLLRYVKGYFQQIGAGTGSGKGIVNKSTFEKSRICVEKDLFFQKKIASILSAYDDLIENNNKRIKILEQMAENLYKEWFVRFRFPGHETAEFENGIPKGWKVVRVKNCLKRLPFNRLCKQDELESSGKVIVIDQSSNEFMGFHNNEPSHYASFEDPIILFGDHSCKFVLMTKNFSLGENVVPFRSINTEELDNYYLYYAVHKLIVTEEYKRHWGRFTAMKFFKPQINLQKKFAEFVKQLVHKKEMLWIQNQNLIKQRDLLLPRIMSGKLEV